MIMPYGDGRRSLCKLAVGYSGCAEHAYNI